jgi:UDP-N-acetylmuramoyl-L-alanyl-D-glutamate--2,6-diaminopimelate ligase
MMRLGNLCPDFIPADSSYSALTISSITQDSRSVSLGALFFAVPGLRVDGRDFIGTVIEKGAAAVLYENNDGYQLPAELQQGKIPLIGVPELSAKIGLIAANFYQHPSENMTVIGVTGTNGKTSITQFVAQIITAHRQRCAVIGTIGKGFLPNLQSTGYTTPDAIALQKDLAECLAQGADSVAMEVSSHSLAQYRVDGTEFDIAVFTNLTREHLDYHGTMVEYGAAKARLFHFPSLKYAIYNVDDPFGLELLARHPANLQALIYSTNPNISVNCPAIVAQKITALPHGFTIDVRTPWGEGRVNTPLLGRFNVSNLLAVIGVAGALNIPLGDCLKYLEQLRPVNGRMQSFGGRDDQPHVIVDFAHSPDALLQVLTSLSEHQPAKLWCVFGCGGDRDRGKRPQMGEIAARYCDHIVITNDNPRSENPEHIAAEIRAGIPSNVTVHIELDRTAAITFALQSAAPDDIVLIAGKGHETEQIIGNQIIPHSDAETVQRLLRF